MSRARVHVALVPPAPGALPARACAVAIDVLRASTSLAVACANGAARIVPFATTAEAIAFRDRTPGALACGEREGRIVPGFDLGNSPAEFTPERVGRRPLAFASTNGARAMLATSGCRRRLLAGFVNLSATVEALANEDEVWLVCAGKLGRFSLEDAACAGTVAARLLERGGTLANHGARLAAALACGDAAEARATVEGSEHGRWLATLGEAYAEDVRRCAGQDSLGKAGEW
jgi:2-phosphosulfolactate phosphatase